MCTTCTAAPLDGVFTVRIERGRQLAVRPQDYVVRKFTARVR